MVPRSFFTNISNASTVALGAVVPLRGIAFGGDCGVLRVDLSVDAGQTWQQTTLGHDEGAHSFRQWQALVTAPHPVSGSGAMTLMARCTNTHGKTQPPEASWNSSGFMRNVIECVQVTLA